MSTPFDAYTEEELQNQGGSAEEISENGMYRFKVLSAFDSYKVNPEDKDDPERSRRVNLRLQVLDAVQDTRKDDFNEPEEDVKRRRQQKGNISNVSLWFDKDGNADLIRGNMRILASIAGSPQDDRPDEELTQKYYKGKEDGKPVFEIGQIADRMHINCSSLVGRDFIGVIQNTEEEYPGLFPWYAERVPDEKQTSFKHPESDEEKVQKRGRLYSGEDTASKRMKRIFDENGEEKEPAYAGEAGGGGDIEDDLPF